MCLSVYILPLLLSLTSPSVFVRQKILTYLLTTYGLKIEHFNTFSDSLLSRMMKIIHLFFSAPTENLHIDRDDQFHPTSSHPRNSLTQNVSRITCIAGDITQQWAEVGKGLGSIFISIEEEEDHNWQIWVAIWDSRNWRDQSHSNIKWNFEYLNKPWIQNYILTSVSFLENSSLLSSLPFFLD